MNLNSIILILPQFLGTDYDNIFEQKPTKQQDIYLLDRHHFMD